MTSLARTAVRVELVARRTNATVNETIMEATAKVCDVMLDEQKRYNNLCYSVTRLQRDVLRQTYCRWQCCNGINTLCYKDDYV